VKLLAEIASCARLGTLVFRAFWLGLGLLAACRVWPTSPDAVSACDADRDCPSGFECRSEDANKCA
jgi:hypothetical protein